MEAILRIFIFFLVFFTQRKISEATDEVHADFPPRGWNSYDSFSWIISEREFLRNAQIVANRLSTHGYQYVVVDFLWYRRKVPGAYTDSYGFDVIDKWGRMVPDPRRWPSSKDGKGFSEVANKVHAMGLKFGIHVMRGLSTQAYRANTPILDTSTVQRLGNPHNLEKYLAMLDVNGCEEFTSSSKCPRIYLGSAYKENGRVWYAKDIGLTDRACAWMPHGFMSVDTKFGAARAFLKSLYLQYAEWGVDFVKHDCIFGDDLNVNEITVVSEVLKELDRPILYSLSPGSSATPAMAKEVNSLVNMYRVTGDDWDTWGDVAFHFNVSRDFAATDMIGAAGLKGKSWPDLDMLPLGWLTDPGSNQGPHRMSKLTLDEQRTQMTLWSMSRSPLMFGGDMRKLSDATYNIIANPILLEINSFSTNNIEFPFITGTNSLTGVHIDFTKKSTSQKAANTLDSHVLHLTSCNDHKAKGWISEVLDNELERICWKDMGGKYTPPFCLYKKKSIFTSISEILDTHRYLGKLHLSASHSTDFCLNASPKQKLTSQELKRITFSPCRMDANQMWELNVNETLVNSYSGLCGVLKPVKANPISGGIRSWVATGRGGEIYLSFFNLSPQKVIMDAKISDLEKVLPGRNLRQGSCRYTEVWTGKDYGIATEKISLAVALHGCALVVLKCS